MDKGGLNAPGPCVPATYAWPAIHAQDPLLRGLAQTQTHVMYSTTMIGHMCPIK